MLPIIFLAGAVMVVWGTLVRGTPERLRQRRGVRSEEHGLPGIGARYANGALVTGAVMILAVVAVLVVDRGA